MEFLFRFFSKEGKRELLASVQLKKNGLELWSGKVFFFFFFSGKGKGRMLASIPGRLKGPGFEANRMYLSCDAAKVLASRPGRSFADRVLSVNERPGLEATKVLHLDKT